MASYWQDREKAHITKMLKNQIDYEKAIHGMYDKLWKAINAEIQQFYSIYAGKEAITLTEAKKAASEFDVQAFADKAKEYVRNRDFSKEANDQLRLYNLTMSANRLELLKSTIGMHLAGMTDDLQKYFTENLTAEAVAELTRQAGILGESLLSAEQYLSIANSIAGASYHNATFSQRLWANQDILKSNMDRLLTAGLIAGKHPNVLARELRDLVLIDKLRGKETADYVARRLMLSESTRIQTAIQKHSYETYGYDEYDYIPESNACPICKAIEKDNPHRTADMMSGENAPPVHNWCRCSTAARYEEKGQTEKDWLNTNLSGKMSKEQAERYNKAIQNAPEEIKRLWEKYGDKLSMRSATEKDGCYSYGSVGMDVSKDMMRTLKKPTNVFFHEYGHFFDHLHGGQDSWASASVKLSNGKTLGSTVYDEIQTLVKRRSKTLGVKALFAKDDIKQELMALYKKDPTTMGSVSDLFGGASNNQMRAEIGHDTGYWKMPQSQKKWGNMTAADYRNEKLGKEAFAEFTAALTMDPAELAVIKQYLPDSYEMYLELLKKMGK